MTSLLAGFGTGIAFVAMTSRLKPGNLLGREWIFILAALIASGMSLGAAMELGAPPASMNIPMGTLTLILMIGAALWGGAFAQRAFRVLAGTEHHDLKGKPIMASWMCTVVSFIGIAVVMSTTTVIMICLALAILFATGGGFMLYGMRRSR